MTHDQTALQVSALPTPMDLAEREIQTLRAALDTRSTIGQAIGIVMTEKSLTSEAAFAHLVEISSNTNVKIRDIAAEMVREANDTALGITTSPSGGTS